MLITEDTTLDDVTAHFSDSIVSIILDDENFFVDSVIFSDNSENAVNDFIFICHNTFKCSVSVCNNVVKFY